MVNARLSFASSQNSYRVFLSRSVMCWIKWMRSLWAPRLRRPFDLEPCGIEGREKEDREHRGYRQPAHDSDRLGPEEVVARQRDHGQDGRRRGQQDGPETSHRRLDDGGPGVASGLFIL